MYDMMEAMAMAKARVDAQAAAAGLFRDFEDTDRELGERQREVLDLRDGLRRVYRAVAGAPREDRCSQTA